MTELHTADFLPAFDGLIPAFPAHSLTRKKQILTEGGAWLVEHQEAQHRRYHSFLLYDQDYIQHRQQESQEAEKQLGEKILDGYYLLNCAKLDDPQDICSIDISNQGLNAAKEDDFDLFINLFHINAAENNLKLECLSSFPMVREIQFQFNSLSKVKLSPNHFLHLDTLDLSYNQISHSGILNIGLIERLRVLVLTANEIKTLPSNMAYPAVDNEKQIYQRFANLEELYLDNNHLCDLSTFATLGALKKLKYLNLAKNHIYYIPHLRVLGSAIAHVEDFKAQNKSAKSTRTKSQRSSANSQKMKQEISNSEFGLTKSKITPIQTKTPKKLMDILPGKDDNSEDSPDVLEDDTPESEISTPDLEDETPAIRDKKPISRPEEEDIETGVSRGDSPASLSREQIVHVGSSSAFPGGSVKSGMMERDMNKSDSPDAIRKNKLNVDAYLLPQISEGKSTAETMYQTAPMPLQQPFPQLQTLILSDNVISEEEGVLACALWPKLCQLVLHNNPVITQCRGLPILLTHELTLRNGITIIRNPPSKVKKPPSVTVSAGTRRIKEPPRPLPRQPHPELLTLESAPSLALPPTTAGSSVPPISPSVSLPEAQKEAPGTGPPDEGVFLTQVDDQEAEEEDEEESEPDILSYTASTVHIPDRYKGFEDLVDVDDDPNDYIPEHIQSAVSSLRKALQKTMILPDIYKPVCNSEVLPRKHIYKSCKGKRLVPKGKKIDKDKPLNDGLRMIRNQNVALEGGLGDYIASENTRTKKQGRRLLDQIQKRYNEVRSECLQQRSSLLEDIRGTDPSMKSSFTLEQNVPSLSILPPRTQASTYDSERVSNTPYTFREEEDAEDSISRESSQYTL